MTAPESTRVGTSLVKRGFAQMVKGGVIMDVVDADQARIAEDAGAVAVMALERVPADIRKDGGVARMSDPDMIDGIKAAVSIPVMAKARIGHFVEAQVLQAIGVDYIDESEVLTPADYANHIDKHDFTVPFVCGATNLGEALRRIAEGAAMIRSKGEAGTGDVSQATTATSARSSARSAADLAGRARALHRGQGPAGPSSRPRPRDWPSWAGCPSYCSPPAVSPPRPTPRMMMQLGADGVFIGSGIFKSGDPAARARAMRRGHGTTSTTPSGSPRSAAVSARPWSALRSTASGPVTCWPRAAGDARSPVIARPSHGGGAGTPG